MTAKKITQREHEAMMKKVVERCNFLFEENPTAKLPVKAALEAVKSAQSSLTNRAIGVALRKSFPSVRRMRKGATKSKPGIWIYYGLSWKTAAAKPLRRKRHSGATKGRKVGEKNTDALPKVHPAMFLETSLIEVGKELGHGVFGTCHKGQYKGSIEVAIKTYLNPEQKNTEQHKSDVIREAEFLLQLPSHKNLPMLIGVSVEKEPFLLVTQLYQVLGRSVTVWKAERYPPSGMKWIDVVMQTAEGLRAIHSCGIVHNDIKDDNVVLVGDRNVGYTPIIVDFGKACQISEKKFTKLSEDEQVKWKRTYRFIAPEVVDGTHPASEATDVYAFGYMLHCVNNKIKVKQPILKELSTLCMSEQAKRPSLFYIIASLREQS